MKNITLVIILISLCLFGSSLAYQTRQRRVPQSGNVRKLPPDHQPKPAEKSVPAIEKLPLDLACRLPNTLVLVDAYGFLHIPGGSRSDKLDHIDALRQASFFIHLTANGMLRHVYECRAYKSDSFAEAYRRHQKQLTDLAGKIEDFKQGKGYLSSSERTALYAVLQAYYTDLAVTLRSLNDASKRSTLSDFFKANETRIEQIAKGNWQYASPSYGPYVSFTEEEEPVRELTRAYLIDLAISLRDALSGAKTPKMLAASQKHGKQIGVLAGKSSKDEVDNQDKTALLAVLRALYVDVAVSLRDARKASAKSPFLDAYTLNEKHVEAVIGSNWEESGLFDAEVVSLCDVISAWRAAR